MIRRMIILLTAVLLALAMTAGPATAALCVVPGNASAASEAIHGDTLIAEAPVAPDDFFERGKSLLGHDGDPGTGNAGGRTAAWEAHFNSPVVGGPAC